MGLTRQLRLALCAAGAAGAVAHAEPTPAEKARADKLFEDGRRYLTAKDYRLACTAFEESQAADPAIGTQLNIALCYEEWGKTASAYRAYQEAERLAKLKFDDRAKFSRKKLDELGAKVPHLQLEAPPDADPSTVFLFDGKEMDRAKLFEDQVLDPGPHEIEARVPGKEPRRTHVELVAGDRKRIAIDVPKPEVKVVVTTAPRSAGKLYGGIALTGAGTAAIVVGSLVALAARNDYADAVQHCSDLVCETRADYDTTQHARTRANEMTFVVGGGLALAAVGVFLIATSRGAKSEQRTALVPVVSPGGLGIAIGGPL